MGNRLTQLLDSVGNIISAATETTLGALSAKFPTAAQLAATFAARPTATQIGAFGYGFDTASFNQWTQLTCDSSGILNTRINYTASTTSVTTAGASENQRGINFGCTLMRLIAYHEASLAAPGALFLVLVNKATPAIAGDAALFCFPFPSDNDPNPRLIHLDLGLPGIQFTNGVQAVASTTQDVVTLPGGANANETRFYLGAR